MSRVRRETWGVVVVGGIGLALFATQNEDRTPMLLYFTIWSAILATISWPSADATRSPAWTIAARASSAGTVLAGLVYWGNLFPVHGAGRQLVTVAANVFLHALLPAAVLVRLARGAARLSVRDEMLTIAWPLLYLLFTGLLALTGTPSPYSFLRPDEGTNLCVIALVFVVIWCAIAFLLRGLAAIAGVRGSAVPDQPDDARRV